MARSITHQHLLLALDVLLAFSPSCKHPRLHDNDVAGMEIGGKYSSRSATQTDITMQKADSYKLLLNTYQY